jgi:hypothetical protein
MGAAGAYRRRGHGPGGRRWPLARSARPISRASRSSCAAERARGARRNARAVRDNDSRSRARCRRHLFGMRDAYLESLRGRQVLAGDESGAKALGRNLALRQHDDQRVGASERFTFSRDPHGS